jgi:hypothetical protein
MGSYKFMGVEEVWPSNWPFVVGDFHFVERCYQAYDALQKEHYIHTDPICYQTSIYCRVLAKWCQMFNVCLNVNDPMVGGQEFPLITKIHHYLSRSFQLSELMRLLGFIQGAIESTYNDF